MFGQSSKVKCGAIMALVATGTFLLAGIAYGAAPVTVTVNIPLSKTISAGQSESDTIGLAPYLSSGPQNFALSDFVLTVTGTPPDVTSYSLLTNPYVLYAVNEVYTGHGYVTYDYYTRNETEVDTDGAPDSISLMVGANQNSASNMSTSSVGPYFETGYTVTGSPAYGESIYITNTNLDVVSYSSLTDILPISAATAAASDPAKGLTYTVTGGTGSTNLNEASLSFLQTAIVSAAPEPATWLMMLMGTGLVGFMLRRQPKGKAAV